MYGFDTCKYGKRASGNLLFYHYPNLSKSSWSYESYLTLPLLLAYNTTCATQAAPVSCCHAFVCHYVVVLLLVLWAHMPAGHHLPKKGLSGPSAAYGGRSRGPSASVSSREALVSLQQPDQWKIHCALHPLNKAKVTTAINLIQALLTNFAAYKLPSKCFQPKKNARIHLESFIFFVRLSSKTSGCQSQNKIARCHKRPG